MWVSFAIHILKIYRRPVWNKKPITERGSFVDIEGINSLIDQSKYNSSSTVFRQNIRGMKDKGVELICSLISNILPHLSYLKDHYAREQNLLN
jgi:hypothetical protein